ncbi:heparan sulfate glucosamine 3-O-sulfotransferase 1 [Rhipicephalus sanguineus]|uniref:heparan sulfate glucosamine 3-O-sulfotransferase 1 n=1 Tax=Rhipicephalus sanguineus TaxID=34632 RepID=UPI0020C21FA1|nr:heparan sulfate glucosamine 3-O-sulfotransferase 1 [Rhipicephalus sanguineus]
MCDGIDPYELRIGKDAASDVNLLPAVTHGDIVNYLVLSTSHVMLQQMKAYKSLDGHNYFASGWTKRSRRANHRTCRLINSALQAESSSNRPRLLALCLAVACGTCFLAAQLLVPPPPLAATTAERQQPPSAAAPPAAAAAAAAADSDSRRRRLPQCLIIGARKCGTRALLEFLALHPSVQKAPDEVHFFDDDERYALGLDWYRRRMPASRADQLTVEKSPAYFVTEAAPGRVWAMNASLLLLLIVRDPVVRLVSDYAQLAANRRQLQREDAPPFERLILLPDGAVNAEYRPVRTSMYAVHLRRWLSHFPRRQLHVVDGDRLVRDPLRELRRVEAFLGLPALIPSGALYFNRTKGFYCLRPRPNDTAGRCLNDSKGRRHPHVPGPVVSRLRQFFAPFNREFYHLMGRDFGWPEQ